MILAWLAACASGEDETGAVACETAAPALARVDAPAGYRVVDAPVDAAWLPEARTVPVNVWYPTSTTEGDAASYLDMWIDPDALVDAPFADPTPGCRMPLVVYSHGYQGWGGNASSLVRHLVSQGWVAAAPDHVENTLTDNVEPHRVSFPLTRVADVVATIDAIEALPEGDPLHDRVDTSRVLVMGHSYGGQTAWLMSGPEFDQDAIRARCDADALGCTDAELEAYAAPATDPRVAAVLPMDGSASTDQVAAEGWAAADRPILYLARSGDGDDVPFTTALAAEVTWGRFEGACHESFTDTNLPCDTFDKDEGHDLIASLTTAFAAQHVLGLAEEPYASVLRDGPGDARVTLRRSWEERSD